MNPQAVAGLLPANPERTLLAPAEPKLLPERAGAGSEATRERGMQIGKFVVGAAEKTADAVNRTVVGLGRLAVRATEAVVDATVRTAIAGTKTAFFAGVWGASMGAALVIGGSWGFDKMTGSRLIRDDHVEAFTLSQIKSKMDAKDASLLTCQQSETSYREKYLTAKLQEMLVEKGLAIEYLWQPDFRTNTYTVKVKSAKAKEEVHCYGNLHVDGDELSPESVTDLDCPHGTPAQLVRVAAESTRSATLKKTVAAKPSPTPTPAP
jgi:hypothetical protein